MNFLPARFVAAVSALLTAGLSACSPAVSPEVEKVEAARPLAATPAPSPTPAAGAWMHEQRANPLGLKDKPLDAKPTK